MDTDASNSDANAPDLDTDASDEFQASLDLGQGGLEDGDNEDQKIAAEAAAAAAKSVGKPVEEITEPLKPDVPEGDLPD
jgi:hypothetical protein